MVGGHGGPTILGGRGMGALRYRVEGQVGRPCYTSWEGSSRAGRPGYSGLEAGPSTLLAPVIELTILSAGKEALSLTPSRPGHELAQDEAEGKLELSREFKTSLKLARPCLISNQAILKCLHYEGTKMNVKLAVCREKSS